MIEYTSFKFCPKCASPSISVFLKNGIKCTDCGYIIFHNMCAAVAGIVEVEDKIILMKRAHEPKAGYFDLPGGFVDYRESLEAALVREVKEELSLDITELRYFGSSPNAYDYAGVNYFTADAFFLCKPVDFGTLRLSEENTEIAVVKPEEVDLETLAFKTMKIMIAKYRDSRR